MSTPDGLLSLIDLHYYYQLEPNAQGPSHTLLFTRVESFVNPILASIKETDFFKYHLKMVTILTHDTYYSNIPVRGTTESIKIRLDNIN